MLCKILRLFLNTLTADRKYPLLNRSNLTQAIQILLSRKQKTSCGFFSAFLKATLNFAHFQKNKMTLIADVFPKLPSLKKIIRKVSVKSRFRGPFDKKHEKRAQRPLKSGEGYLYHICSSL